jgi:glycosyltransferase involved in cell wall biosynthesis/ribosomal protein S18 acetylase RimI-like enzyme
VKGLRVCVVGSFPPPEANGLPTQGVELASRLGEVCSRVSVVSRQGHPIGRLLHSVAHLSLHGPRYDTLCVQTFGNRALLLEGAAILLGRLWRRRVVLCLRGGGLPARLDRAPWPSLWLYGLADASVCPSGYMQQEMARHGLHPQVIPNALDPSRYPFRARSHVRPWLLWMRTMHPFYNPMLALRSFELVRQRYPDARLTMAGVDRGMAAEIRAAAVAKGLPVTFPGVIPKPEIPALMEGHDIYLNTPHVDNMPVNVIEGLLCGLPVVATNVGGIPYLLRHEETGLLVPDDDAEAMAAAIVRLVESPALAHLLSCSGRAYAEGFSWEETLPQWLDALSPVGDARGRGRHLSSASRGSTVDEQTLRVRRIEAKDLPDVVAIHLQSFRGYRSALLGPSFLRRFYHWFLVDPRAYGFVAEFVTPETELPAARVDGAAVHRAPTTRLAGFAVGAPRGSGPAMTRYTAAAAVGALGSRPWLLGHPLILSGIRRKLGQVLGSRSPVKVGVEPDSTPAAALVGIGVAPRFQGHGVGRRLIDAFEEEAIRRGYPRAVLGVRRENRAACGFYDRCGWGEWESLSTPEDVTYVKLLTDEPTVARELTRSADG